VNAFKREVVYYPNTNKAWIAVISAIEQTMDIREFGHAHWPATALCAAQRGGGSNPFTSLVTQPLADLKSPVFIFRFCSSCKGCVPVVPLRTRFCHPLMITSFNLNSMYFTGESPPAFRFRKLTESCWAPAVESSNNDGDAPVVFLMVKVLELPALSPRRTLSG
jgi:hypothetical protein